MKSFYIFTTLLLSHKMRTSFWINMHEKSQLHLHLHFHLEWEQTTSHISWNCAKIWKSFLPFHMKHPPRIMINKKTRKITIHFMILLINSSKQKTFQRNSNVRSVLYRLRVVFSDLSSQFISLLKINLWDCLVHFHRAILFHFIRMNWSNVWFNLFNIKAIIERKTSIHEIVGQNWFFFVNVIPYWAISSYKIVMLNYWADFVFFCSFFCFYYLSEQAPRA